MADMKMFLPIVERESGITLPGLPGFVPGESMHPLIPIGVYPIMASGDNIGTLMPLADPMSAPPPGLPTTVAPPLAPPIPVLQPMPELPLVFPEMPGVPPHITTALDFPAEALAPPPLALALVSSAESIMMPQPPHHLPMPELPLEAPQAMPMPELEMTFPAMPNPPEPMQMPALAEGPQLLAEALRDLGERQAELIQGQDRRQQLRGPTPQGGANLDQIGWLRGPRPREQSPGIPRTHNNSIWGKRL